MEFKRGFGRQPTASTPLRHAVPIVFPIPSPINNVADIVHKGYSKSASVIELVCEAIKNIGLPRKGASLFAIKKWIFDQKDNANTRTLVLIRKAILKGLEDGAIKRAPGTKTCHGVAGSFLLNPVKQAKTVQKRKATMKKADDKNPAVQGEKSTKAPSANTRTEAAGEAAALVSKTDKQVASKKRNAAAKKSEPETKKPNSATSGVIPETKKNTRKMAVLTDKSRQKLPLHSAPGPSKTRQKVSNKGLSDSELHEAHAKTRIRLTSLPSDTEAEISRRKSRRQKAGNKQVKTGKVPP